MSSSKTGEAMKAPFPTWREVHDLKTEVTALQEQNRKLREALGHAVHRDHQDTDWCSGCELVRAALKDGQL